MLLRSEPAGSARALRRTPLFEAHRRRGARMIDFGGWEMPVQYSGILPEHRAVRTGAGLFDVSHMGEVEVRGPGALAACQLLLTNDLAKLGDGAALYSAMCHPDGGIVDDVIVTRLDSERFLFCVNAANRRKDADWIAEHVGHRAQVVDRSDELALLALQGPRAASVFADVAEPHLLALGRFRVGQGRVAGAPALVSRTGYTGEDGFEVYLAPEDAERVWEALLERGSGAGVLPIGLGARDTLRLEKGLMLYGNDIDDTTTPLEAGLAWVVKLGKGDFIGGEALRRQREAGVERRLVGLVMEDTAIPRHGYAIQDGGEVIGRVTSGTVSPMLRRGIALGYVPPSAAEPGRRVEVAVRGSPHTATVTRPPFYRGDAGAKVEEAL